MVRSQSLIIGSGLLALALSVVVWPIVGLAVTVAHEGAHAIAGSVMGGKIKSITLSRDGGGATKITGLGPLGTFFTALAGYLGPSVFGLAGAMLLVRDRVEAVLWVSLVLLVLALLQTGNWVARVAVVLVGGLIVVVLRYASAGQLVFFAYTWIWFLLIGGFGQVLVLQNLRRKGPDSGSDAFQLRKLSFLPASLWSGFFWLTTVSALLYGATILLGLVEAG